MDAKKLTARSSKKSDKAIKSKYMTSRDETDSPEKQETVMDKYVMHPHVAQKIQRVQPKE